MCARLIMKRLLLSSTENTDVYWTKDGKKLKAKKKDKRLKIDLDTTSNTSVLEVAQAGMEDAGEYAVVAENEAGLTSCTVSVNVVSKVEKMAPQLTVFPKPTLAQEGETVQLSCSLIGNTLILVGPLE